MAEALDEVGTSGNTTIENIIADSPKQFYSTIRF
jgi:hypothetical protein